MTTSQQKPPPKTKGAKSERQKRLSTALRENLRKRKAQSQEREKSKASEV
ncbi:MAG: hypothetical protein K2Y18_09910 [Alphaproteobacteria bacterium]|jgi:hypothetical protein|nr:hypothetical protein [Alphaproteobacteria bacterium]